MSVEQIISNILIREGGEYTNDPTDGGGPTRWGITLATLQDYRGKPCTAADVAALSQPEAAEIYHFMFVIKPGFDQIKDAALQELVVDAGVQHGSERVSGWLQAVCNAQFGDGLKVDNHLGQLSLAAINRHAARLMYVHFLARRNSFYAEIVHKRPDQVKFIEGWDNRINEFILRLA